MAANIDQHNKKEKLPAPWYEDKFIIIAVHISIWVIIVVFPYIFNDEGSQKNPFRDLNMVTNIFRVGLFYLNAELLLPLLVYRKKWIVYILSLGLLFYAMMVFHGALYGVFRIPKKFYFFASAYHNVLAFIITLVASSVYKMISDKTKNASLRQSKQNEKLKTELSFLRSQISPHFILNVLNNIVAMVRMKSEELEPTIMKLSALIQYMLYETDENKIPLQKEIEYIQNYIELQRQRFGDFVRIHVSLETPARDYLIEPMLLIPFVENAFKHGVGLIKDPEISVRLWVDGNVLGFKVRNKYSDGNNDMKDKTSGIGLANVSRRLVLLYRDKHSLTIDRVENYFNISLRLNLA
jgi:two-component system, LytTR family, sensor kinase